MAKPKIVVIGSINMDLISRLDHLPKPGETIGGDDLIEAPGGKGANQAVAAARLGGDVHMVGRVGDDAFASLLRRGLDSDGVSTRFVKSSSGASGIALILLQKSGENSIVISAGANAKITKADVDAALPVLRKADAVLLQLEIPIPVVLYAIKLCKRLGVRVILDPAPARRDLPKELFDIDVICPNETEAAELLSGRSESVDAAAKKLLDRGADNVVLKLGAKGSKLINPHDTIVSRGFKVKVVDTTAAGDTMTAGLAIALAEGKSWPDALRFANAAGALACTKLGAQPSIPSRREVINLFGR